MAAGDQNSFYVCFYLKDGTPVGHILSPENDFPADIESADKKAAEDVASEQSADKNAAPGTLRSDGSPFAARFSEFVSAMLGYIEFVPPIIGVGTMVSQGLLLSALRKFLEANSSRTEKSKTREIFEVPREFYLEFKRLQDTHSAAIDISHDVPRMLTVGLVSTYEYHLSRLMKEIARARPESIFAKNQTISIQDVLAASSLDAVKDTVLNERN
jgi:hypothetical protein